MAIDGISKPSGLPPPLSTQSSAVEPTARFTVERTAPSDKTAGADPLSRLQRGEITREQYLEARVEEAAAPFATRLDPEQFEFMKSVLRDKLDADPVTLDLVRRATAGLE